MPATISADRGDAHGRCRIPNSSTPGDEGADRADAGPDRVGGAHRDGALRQHQQRAAHRHGHDGEEQPPGLRAVRAPALLEAERPADLEQRLRRQDTAKPCVSPPATGGASLTAACRPVLIEGLHASCKIAGASDGMAQLDGGHAMNERELRGLIDQREGGPAVPSRLRAADGGGGADGADGDAAAGHLRRGDGAVASRPTSRPSAAAAALLKVLWWQGADPAQSALRGRHQGPGRLAHLLRAARRLGRRRQPRCRCSPPRFPAARTAGWPPTASR